MLFSITDKALHVQRFLRGPALTLKHWTSSHSPLLPGCGRSTWLPSMWFPLPLKERETIWGKERMSHLPISHQLSPFSASLPSRGTRSFPLGSPLKYAHHLWKAQPPECRPAWTTAKSPTLMSRKHPFSLHRQPEPFLTRCLGSNPLSKQGCKNQRDMCH